MSYIVIIEQVGPNGAPTGQPVVRNLPSKREAFALMRGAALDAQKARQRMLFSLYDQGTERLMSYGSSDRAVLSFGTPDP